MTDKKISEEFADEDALASHIKTLIDDCEEHSKSQKARQKWTLVDILTVRKTLRMSSNVNRPCAVKLVLNTNYRQKIGG